MSSLGGDVYATVLRNFAELQ